MCISEKSLQANCALYHSAVLEKLRFRTLLVNRIQRKIRITKLAHAKILHKQTSFNCRNESVGKRAERIN